MIEVLEKEYSKQEVFELMKKIKKEGNVKYRNDVNFISDVINKFNEETNPSFSSGQKTYLKDIIFKYGDLMDEFVELDISEEDMKWAKKQIDLFEKTGAYRYKEVKAYRGVASEKVIFEWLKEKYPNLESNDPIGEGDGIDKFDFKLNEITVDIKCATEWKHASVTPKVNVANSKPKDYYICGKYDDREETEDKIIVLGYLPENNVKEYPIKQKYGARYYEVKLRDVNPIENIINIFNTTINNNC